MKIYKVHEQLIAERSEIFYDLEGWTLDQIFQTDKVFKVLSKLIDEGKVAARAKFSSTTLEPPIESQELWASGVTYLRSKAGREEESEASGGANFYDKVYHADRPELFFKATRHRIVGHGGKVRIRRDSTWNVPEPELTMAINSHGKIIGYTIGNDMSSRSIEGENPLYLPQAKTYDGCASLGPCLLLASEAMNPNTKITIGIQRDGEIVFQDGIEISQMKRSQEELVSYLFSECSFPFGCFLMTGTGIVPSKDFTLQSKDVISIIIDPVGELVNSVE